MIAWKGRLPEASASPLLPVLLLKLCKAALILYLTWEVEGGFEGDKGSSLQMSWSCFLGGRHYLFAFSCNSRSTRSESPGATSKLSPLSMSRGEKMLASPCCSCPIYDTTKVSFACAAEKT